MSPEHFSRILVVEDSQGELHLLCNILNSEGFNVIGCSSAAEGLEHVQQRDFDVAVVDLRLPELSGSRLLKRIREIDDEVRVIIYTGSVSYDSVKEAINLGAFAYVEKLSDPSELLRHVYRACRERVDRYASTLEDAVTQRTEELARSNRELEDFASVVAHDLRSPLLTISGYCQLLQEEYENQLDTEANEYLSHVIGGAARMNRLIEDLLEYSRLGHPKDHLRRVSLESVLAQVSANLESTIRENKAEIHHDPLPTVTGNQTQLVQLFQNLLDNAIKFRQEVDPQVHIGATHNDGHWSLTVKDNGIGIKPEHFEQLYQVFHRLHGREYPGTGIGLAVCKKIVERHGGRIWVESEFGSGTTFSFTLASGETSAI